MVKTALTRGGFTAELFFDRKGDPPIYHYIITSVGSPQILAWGQLMSKAEAEAEVRETIDQLAAGMRRTIGTG